MPSGRLAGPGTFVPLSAGRPSVRLDGDDLYPSRGPAVTTSTTATTTSHPRGAGPDRRRDRVDGRVVAGQQLPDDRADLPAGQPAAARPLVPDDIKPRLLGHWGTSPGCRSIYAHVSRLIRHTGQETIYLAGPGHGGPALVAAGYLEGTYSEIYPTVTLDEAGVRRLFRQFSTPGGIPSHVSVTTPGSIHEGGELGYVLVHAFGAVMDNPDLLALAVVGDGEAETGPLEGSWKGISLPQPARATARCCRSCTSTATRSPARRCSAARTRPRCAACSRATATTCSRSRVTTCRACTSASRQTLATAYGRIRAIQQAPRATAGMGGAAALAAHRAAHAEGLDRPGGGRRHPGHRARGARTRCRSRASRTTPSTSRSSRRGCAPTGPRSSSTTPARPIDARAAGQHPEGDLRMSASPHANGGRAHHATSTCPTSATSRVDVPRPAPAARGVDPAPSAS